MIFVYSSLSGSDSSVKIVMETELLYLSTKIIKCSINNNLNNSNQEEIFRVLKKVDLGNKKV